MDPQSQMIARLLGQPTTSWPTYPAQPNPGYVTNRGPAVPRSESTEYERARREMQGNPSYSMIGAMFSPQQSALVDAIRAGAAQRMQQAGPY